LAPSCLTVRIGNNIANLERSGVPGVARVFAETYASLTLVSVTLKPSKRSGNR